MRCILLYILFVAVIPIFIFSEPLQLDQQIQQWLIMLDDCHSQNRYWALAQLTKLGDQVVPQAIAQYPCSNYPGRRMIVRLLSHTNSPETNELFLKFLQDEDIGVRNLAIIELLDRCDKEPQLLEKIKQLGPQQPAIQSSIRIFFNTYYHKKVEEGLFELISHQGGFGTYEGQFNKMLPLKENAITPLIDIFCCKKNAEYQFVRRDFQLDTEAAYKIRYLAGSAFASFATVMTPEQKRKVILVLERMSRSNLREEEQLREIARTSLYFMGKKDYINDEIERLQRKIRYDADDAESYAELGLVYLRIGKDELALNHLKKAVRIAPTFGHAHYNLACAYACLNQKDNALQSLENAVNSGYDDLEWMLKDGDLRSLHNEPRFIAIINNLQNQIKPQK